MKNFIRKIGAFCLLLTVLVMLLPLYSKAAEKIDLGKNVTFTLFHEVNGKKVEGVEYSIYQVGKVTTDGKVSFVKPFSEYGLKLDMNSKTSVKNTADALYGYILRDNISALDTSKTDANGVVVFPTKNTLVPALYLVTAKSYQQADGSVCNVQPILLTLPYADSTGSLLYDVKVESKYEILTDTTQFSVLKVWKDKTTHYRPGKIKVELINKNTGKVYDTVTLSKSNQWRYTWKNLPARTAWTVIEKSVPKYYKVSYERDGSVIEITNTSSKTYETPKEPNEETPDNPVSQPPSSPQTGGSKLPQTGTLWWPVPILAIAGMVCILIGMIRKRG